MADAESSSYTVDATVCLGTTRLFLRLSACVCARRQLEVQLGFGGLSGFGGGAVA